MIADIILTIIFMIPVYGFLIWAYNCPEDCLMLGKRWKYQEEPEFSPSVIRYIKFASIFTMIGSPVVLLTQLLESEFFGISLMIFVFVFLVGAFIILTANRES